MTVAAPADSLTRAIQMGFMNVLERTEPKSVPYRHWLMTDVIPDGAARDIAHLPIAQPQGLVFSGRRETNNATRTYFDVATRQKFPVVRAFAEAFQSSETVAFIERICGTNLSGTSLRVEFCQDAEGFWLEPHTDIGVKKFTMSLFLCEGEGGEDMGTDIFDADKKWFARAPSPFNSAMLFIPSNITFHGFQARKFPSTRRSLIINYVTQEWRNRHELAYPETPVRGQA
jgi:hypothetical protein